MKNLSALLLCGAICFTPLPAFANEVSADTEQSAAVFSNYKDYDGWIYGQTTYENTIMPVPCSGTIIIGHDTMGDNSIKILDSDRKTVAAVNPYESGGRMSVPVTAGTYYMILEGPDSTITFALFEPSVDYTGWVFNGYWFAKTNPQVKYSAKDEIWYFYKNGQYLTGWQYINNAWYYFRDGIYPDGYMLASSWVYANDMSGKKYYVAQSGRMISNNWIKVDGDWYYAKKDGSIMTNSWLYSKGKWYWLDEDGVMAANEWIEQDGKWYYLRPSGAMAANETICGNKFDSHGVWLGKA